MSKFDEYQSAETAKHVRRSMVANARDGFWNGARPPVGYKVVIAERRGDKDKKVLAVDETEAPIVRKIFSLYLEGDGASGPMGIKKIVSWLNVRNYLYRRREELALLRAAKINSEGAINRLYELLEQGLASPSDRDFAERLAHHRQRIAALTADIVSLERQLASSQCRITPDVVGRFGNLLREGLRGEHPALRQAYVRLLIDQVTGEADQVRIRGSRKALERAVIATAASSRANVPSSARE